MTATIQFIRETFSKFNALCFEGKLPPVPIVLTYARTFLGKVTYTGKRDFFGNIIRNEDYTLRISTAFDLSERDLEDVVIHEMIHCYIALNGIRDNSVHGEVFRSMMNAINVRFGRNVTVRHHCEEGGDPASRMDEFRPHWLCVTRLDDGNWGITSCAKTKIFEIHRTLPKYYRLKSMEWYGSEDPFFNRYPRSKTPKIYRITREELDKHLADALSLVCDGHSIMPKTDDINSHEHKP